MEDKYRLHRLVGVTTNEEIANRVSDHVKTALSLEDDPHINYSAYETITYDDPWLVRDNLNHVVLQGKVKLYNKYGNQYESEILNSPTWLDVCVYTEEMIRKTGDTSHIFLEGIEVSTVIPDNMTVEPGVTLAYFMMGS